MKRLIDVAPNTLNDIKKRASRDFAMDLMPKDSFDKICDHIDSIIQIVRNTQMEVGEEVSK
jgi:hypothetical protein